MPSEIDIISELQFSAEKYVLGLNWPFKPISCDKVH